MVPQKVWESKNAQRLNFYEKIEFSKPSELLQKQVLLETIDVALRCRRESTILVMKKIPPSGTLSHSSWLLGHNL